MRGLISLSAVAVIGVALVMPAYSGAQTPTQDSVTGTVFSSDCGGVLTVDARSGPSGENPTGMVSCPAVFGGPVFCLSVTDNVALLSVAWAAGGPVAVRITDRGSTGDTFEGFPGFGCPFPVTGYVNFEFTGDFVVVDAQPLPASKDECKSGGWQTYGVFKNQGDCVSFVATGGKNPPGGG